MVPSTASVQLPPVGVVKPDEAAVKVTCVEDEVLTVNGPLYPDTENPPHVILLPAANALEAKVTVTIVPGSLPAVAGWV